MQIPLILFYFGGLPIIYFSFVTEQTFAGPYPFTLIYWEFPEPSDKKVLERVKACLSLWRQEFIQIIRIPVIVADVRFYQPFGERFVVNIGIEGRKSPLPVSRQESPDLHRQELIQTGPPFWDLVHRKVGI
jgi:hypothetical protein